MSFRFTAVALLAGLNVLAAPTAEIARRQSITTLSNSTIDAFTPYAFFASAGYCDPSVTLTWSCGANCDANAGFVPIATGGDGDGTQFWFVGYDPSLNTVVVSHQGTKPAEIMSDLTDLNFTLDSLNSTLFPGINGSIQVHNGFAAEQAKTAADVLAAVQKGLSQYDINTVATVGHSLGAALSLLDSVFLPLNIPGLNVSYHGFGLPRVGNQDFANYIDSTISSFTRITNLQDPVPIVPGRSLGFVHPSNEAHIIEDLSWRSCPGQDNADELCSVGDTPNILVADVGNHDGPYNGITMGC